MSKCSKQHQKKDEPCPTLHQRQMHWSKNIQARPLPSWLEAFEYAYALGRHEVHQENARFLAALDDD